jgi:hypothetical protein
MTRNMSADTRRRFIDYIVNTNLGLHNSVWWDEQNCNAETAAYRDWALARVPTLRDELEAMSDDQILAKYERCRNELPEWWFGFFADKKQQQERQEELERIRKYHRTFARKGGRAQQSRKQPEIMEACKDIRAHNPKITAKKAYEMLHRGGYKMPDGRVIRFAKPMAFESFRQRYWSKPKTLL